MEMEDPLDDMSRFVRGPLTGLAINDEIWTVSLLNLNQWKPNDTNIDRDVHSAVVFEGRGNINKVMDEKYNILAAPEPFGFGPPLRPPSGPALGLRQGRHKRHGEFFRIRKLRNNKKDLISLEWGPQAH